CGIGKHLNETIRIAAGLGAATGFEREGARLVLMSLSFQLLFGFTYAGNLWPRVYYARYEVVIDVGFLACQPFGHIYAFVFSFVGQHSPLNHIADGVYTGHGCFEVFVHGYLFSPLVQGNADVFQAEAFGISCASHRYDTVVALPFDGFTFRVFRVDGYFFPLSRGTGYFVAEVEFHA